MYFGQRLASSFLPSGPLPDAVRFDKDLVRKKVDAVPRAAAGASGMRPQLLKDISACGEEVGRGVWRRSRQDHAEGRFYERFQYG